MHFYFASTLQNFRKTDAFDLKDVKNETAVLIYCRYYVRTSMINSKDPYDTN